MSLTVINDWHLGAIRSGGTTPATAYQLRQDLLAHGERILQGVTGDLLVNGDLFDGPDIPRADLLAAIGMFSRWLDRNPDAVLYLSDGNHDLDKNSQRLSSFQFFAKLLEEMYSVSVVHIEGSLTPIGHGAYVLPHVANQDLANIELAKVPECDYLFVHMNYDNEFAVEADHSLNMSRAQAEALPVKHIVFGHEHQGRTALKDKVIIVGNQFPSSISDCLGGRDKEVFEILDDGDCGLQTCWQPEGDFSEQDWRDLKDEGRFIRVTGTAAAAEAAQVITAISRFRASAKALVITNAVKVGAVDDGAALALSHEEITSFNVREALREYLTDDENKKIDNLKATHHADQP